MDTSSFAELGLNERLLKAVEKAGYTQPTAVQEAVIPAALYGQDLMVGAKTGSGKTAAFVLPMLDRLQRTNPRNTGTRALVLVPTRELAKQVANEIKALSAFTFLKNAVITGGEDWNKQKITLRDNPEILVATPGRLLEHMEKGATDFDDLEVLVIDEADRMFDMGFTEDVLKIAEACDIERQTLFFSATLKKGQIKRVAEQVLSEPETLMLDTVRDSNEAITQQYILADDDAHRERLLNWLLGNETYTKVLVFTNSRESAQALGESLGRQREKVAYIHGDLDQPVRNQIMAAYRDGRAQVLVATDVASRGLDIEGVDLVINFHMARNGDDYVHRIGRTGRAGEEGIAISFIGPNEWNLKASISRYLNIEMASRKIKALEGLYKGPKKVKSNGKAASTKKKKTDAKKQNKKPTKNSVRPTRVAKEKTREEKHGFVPLKKKKGFMPDEE